MDIILPQRTQYALDVLRPDSSSQYLPGRLQRQVYWLSDGSHDVARIACLLHKSPQLIASIINDLVLAGYLVLHKSSRQFSIDVALLRQSFTVIQPHQYLFAQRFYEYLFWLDPRLREPFASIDMQRQTSISIMTLEDIITALERGSDLSPLLRQIELRNMQYGVSPHYYPVAGNALIATFKEFLRWDYTQEVERSWQQTVEMIIQEIHQDAMIA